MVTLIMDIVLYMWWNSYTHGTPECQTFVQLLNIIHLTIKEQNKLYLNKCRNHHCWHRIHFSCRGLDLLSTRLHLDIPSLYPWTSQDCMLNSLQQKADSCRFEGYYFLVCDTVESGRPSPMFWENILPYLHFHTLKMVAEHFSKMLVKRQPSS